MKKIIISVMVFSIVILIASCESLRTTQKPDTPEIALIVKAKPVEPDTSKIALVVKAKPADEIAEQSGRPDLALVVQSPVVAPSSDGEEKEVFARVEVPMESIPEVQPSQEDKLQIMPVTVSKGYSGNSQPIIYSIQTGSFLNIAEARRQLFSTMENLYSVDIDYYRIVKIGQYYAVRIGKFPGYSVAKRYLQANQPLLSSAIILENLPKNGKNGHAPEYKKPVYPIYTIQAGSLVSMSAAQNQFTSIMEGLDDADIEYLRIVKIGKYYAVRLGKFEGFSVARNYLQSNQTELDSAIVLENYPKKRDTWHVSQVEK